ncbi:outer membrane beta-barrel protein [Antarcticibacterium arcticum]|uniref:Outer membrane beta-barrel protein n=1 Tax=Antarcticibacterium arcticum TaxID=2585771 RepID=A0A5B8YKA6_9FLAO|nr:outer membrane beta-barrel protein [Antarcticibacterium arcticum]QED38460.1 outer membrane beta-barrel protein [Antarcticibacterium arcticum]
MKLLLILLVGIFCSLTSYSQPRLTGDSYNRLGIQAGINYTRLQSDTFLFKYRPGLMAGLTTRANTVNKFLVIYGVNFYQFNTGIDAMVENSQTQTEFDFKATGVQINLFLGHKLIGEHLSLGAGPVVQINSKLIPEKGKDKYRLRDYNLVAEDLQDISRLNFNLAANVSFGFPSIKFWGQYQYGITNMLRNLDLVELQKKDSRITSLKGNLGMAVAGMVVYF